MEAFDLGAYDYLAQPCSLDELLVKIEGAWKKKDMTESRTALSGMIGIQGCGNEENAAKT